MDTTIGRRLLARWREVPEVIAFILGVFLRYRLRTTFKPGQGYDWSAHLHYIRFVADHHALPPLDATRTAYHPPLFYWIAALGLRQGWTPDQLQRITVAFGVAKLALLWYGLRRLLPDDRLARVGALLLAVTLPCAIHLDGMVTEDSLLGPVAVVAMLLIPRTFATGDQRISSGLLLGLVLALGALTKVSGLILIAAVAGGLGVAALEAARRRQLRVLVGPAIAVVLALGIVLPFQARRFWTSTGKLFPTAYDTRPAERSHAATVKSLYLDHRTVGYFVGSGGVDFWKDPVWPSGTDQGPNASSRFWPLMIATTFGDFYRYHYWHEPRPGRPIKEVNRAMVLAGVPIAVTVFGAFAVVALQLWRRRERELDRLVLLAIPLLAVLGQLHLAIKFPLDGDGPVKGHYSQFAAPPLFALFGLAVSWAWRRRWWRPVAVLQLLALSVVVAGAIYARQG